MKVKTTDLCDRYAPELAVADPVFKDYGGTPFFAGEIATVQVYEDNILVRRTLEEPGHYVYGDSDGVIVSAKELTLD